MSIEDVHRRLMNLDDGLRRIAQCVDQAGFADLDTRDAADKPSPVYTSQAGPIPVFADVASFGQYISPEYWSEFASAIQVKVVERISVSPEGWEGVVHELIKPLPGDGALARLLTLRNELYTQYSNLTDCNEQKPHAQVSFQLDKSLDGVLGKDQGFMRADAWHELTMGWTHITAKKTLQLQHAPPSWFEHMIPGLLKAILNFWLWEYSLKFMLDPPHHATSRYRHAGAAAHAWLEGAFRHFEADYLAVVEGIEAAFERHEQATSNKQVPAPQEPAPQTEPKDEAPPPAPRQTPLWDAIARQRVLVQPDGELIINMQPGSGCIRELSLPEAPALDAERRRIVLPSIGYLGGLEYTVQAGPVPVFRKFTEFDDGIDPEHWGTYLSGIEVEVLERADTAFGWQGKIKETVDFLSIIAGVSTSLTIVNTLAVEFEKKPHQVVSSFSLVSNDNGLLEKNEGEIVATPTLTGWMGYLHATKHIKIAPTAPADEITPFIPAILHVLLELWTWEYATRLTFAGEPVEASTMFSTRARELERDFDLQFRSQFGASPTVLDVQGQYAP